MGSGDGSRGASCSYRGEVFPRLQEQKWGAAECPALHVMRCHWLPEEKEALLLLGRNRILLMHPSYLGAPGYGGKNRIWMKSERCPWVRGSLQLKQGGGVFSEKGKDWGTCFSWSVCSGKSWQLVL